MPELRDFEKQTEEQDNNYEEVVKDMPGKSEGFEYEEEIIITKIS